MGTWSNWQSVLIYTGFFMLMFYFFIMLPRKLSDKKHDKMVAGLEKGDKIVTIGGIHGQVSKVNDATIMFKIAQNVEVELSKRAIAYQVDE